MTRPIIATIVLILAAGALFAANELATSVSVSYSKSPAQVQMSVSKSITVTGTPVLDQIVQVSTNGSTITTVSSMGFTVIHNLSTQNFLTAASEVVGATQTVYQIKIGASEWGAFRPNGSNLLIKADTTNFNARIVQFSN